MRDPIAPGDKEVVVRAMRRDSMLRDKAKSENAILFYGVLLGLIAALVLFWDYPEVEWLRQLLRID